jgi:hypothetical protein
MKKQLLLFLIIIPVFGILQGQNLIRVNNVAGADADYASLQEANDNASDGDTIYVEGSTIEYEGADISRRLTIFGPGYFLSENDSTQANGLEAVFNGQINFNAGSNGSTMAGCNLPTGYLYISADDIHLTRCRVAHIEFQGDIENILILQNLAGSIETVSYQDIISNSVISNNIVNYRIDISANSGPLQIINNVVDGTYGGYSFPINVYNSTIANNIICYSSGVIAENTGNTITNNLLAADGTNANGNQYNMAMANVFADYDGSLDYSTDGKWQLKEGSPAIGAGVGGVDCGAFGGITPYVLSGLPDLPHIYEAVVPGTAIADEGLPVTIRVKSGK